MMAEKPIFKFYRSGATGLIRYVCDEIGLVNIINQSVEWDTKQWNVSPGQHVMALVINALCGRQPLYRVKEFYEEQDVEALFGSGITAHDFNDDALGRTLDCLYKANPKAIFTSISLHNLMNSNQPLLFAHADTTSKSVYGAYAREKKPDTLNISNGFSKDHRPDLKQIVMGLLTVNRGTPLFGNVNDGNLDDKTWNGQMVQTIADTLEPEQIRKLVYVADSAFFTKKNVLCAHDQKLSFISLVSENHKLRRNAIEQVLRHPAMEDIGRISDQAKASEYKIQEVGLCFHGVDLRCIVVYSSNLFQQKQATFQRRLQKEKKSLEKEAENLMKREFSCQKDAQKAWEQFEQKHRNSLFPRQCNIKEITRRAPRKGRGRPKKSEEPVMETVYTLDIKIAPIPQDVIAKKEKFMGYFVLATNHQDTEQLPAAQVLREYKQQSSVELRFKFLKDPMFVDALFLKNPERLEALGYVLLMALFIYMTIENRLRLALSQKNTRIHLFGGWRTSKPTAKQIIQLLSHINIIYWYDRDDGRWYRDVTYNERIKRVFELLEIDPACYTAVPIYER